MSMRVTSIDELERLFDQMSRQLAAESETPRPAESGDETERAAMDVAETEEAFVVTVNLPGFERDDVSVRLRDRTLEVTAERDETSEMSDADYVRRERRMQSVRRMVSIPGEIDPSEVVGEMNNGVLTVRLPRRAADTGHEIDIE